MVRPGNDVIEKFIDYKKLSYASLAVLFLGVVTIIVTVWMFNLYHPEYFVNNIPTISKSAAFYPGSVFFEIGMTGVSICGFISWYLIFLLNNYRINKIIVSRHRKILLKILNICTFVLGTIAAISLALFTIITLEVNLDIHVIFSKYFFFSEIFAFIVDSICYVLLIEYSNKYLYVVDKKSFYIRYTICILVIVTSLIYYFMFENRGIFINAYYAQLLYVISEHVTAILCFSYVAAYFPDIYKHIDLLNEY